MNEQAISYSSHEGVSAERQSIDSVLLEDGRRLAFNQSGHSEYAIFDFHGSPGSRYNPIPRNFILFLHGVKIISFDRPGYGESDSNEGRIVADTADDVRQLADTLGIEKFGLLARSGGVPHALGCAALMPERISGMVCMAGLAPRTELPEWTINMTAVNQQKHTLALQDPTILAEQFEQHARDSNENSRAIYEMIAPDLPEVDRAVIPQGDALQALVSRSHREGLKRGGAGWLEDTLAVNNPEGWGFDIGAIRCPTILLHGRQDPFVDTSHTEKLRSMIPGSISVIHEEFGHFGGMAFIEPTLSYLYRCGVAFESNDQPDAPDKDRIERSFSFHRMHDTPLIPKVDINGSFA